MMRFTLLTACVLLAACRPQLHENTADLPTEAQPPLPTAPLTLVGPQGQVVPVTVEIADEEPEREAGLMFRTELVSGTGMLFVFPAPQRLSFWMKNTPLPLDLIFFKEDGEHLATVAWAKPHDETPLGPNEPATTVLEVPGGWAAANGVGPGWRLGRP
jgi:uncharacterized membrane protein (UPF0127 family)